MAIAIQSAGHRSSGQAQPAASLLPVFLLLLSKDDSALAQSVLKAGWL